MKQNLILWIAAFLITFLAGYISNATSKYYPVSGTIGIDAKKVSYVLDKLHNAKDNYKVIVRSDVPNLTGTIQWRQNKIHGWNEISMKTDGPDLLVGEMPALSPLETIEYRIKVIHNGKEYLLPGEKPVTLKILGDVPGTISVLYYLTLLGGLLLSTRTGLEYFREKNRLGLFTIVTLILFFLYTIAVSPVKTTFELNVLNKRVPFITELFNIQSIILLLLWIAGMWGAFKAKNNKLFVLVISVLTLLVFLLV